MPKKARVKRLSAKKLAEQHTADLEHASETAFRRGQRHSERMAQERWEHNELERLRRNFLGSIGRSFEDDLTLVAVSRNVPGQIVFITMRDLRFILQHASTPFPGAGKEEINFVDNGILDPDDVRERLR